MRAVAALVFVSAGLLAGCGDRADTTSQAAPGLRTTTPLSPSPTPGAGDVSCLPLPEPAPPLDWLPDGLPLPEGTYPVQDTPTSDERVHIAVLAVPLSHANVVGFAAQEWPRHGWATARVETELFDAEGAFIRGSEWGGFRARPVYCDPTWSEVVLSVGTS